MSMKSVGSVSVIAALILWVNGLFAQGPLNDRGIDSLSRLIKKEKNRGKIRELILERAIQYPVAEYNQAVREVQQVLSEAQRAKDAKNTVHAYVTLGNVSHKNKKYKEALDYDSLALKAARSAGYRKGESLALGNIAREQQAGGDLREAKQNYLSALNLALSLQAGDVVDLLTYYNQLGVISRILGEFPLSAAYLEKGIQLAEAEDNRRVLALLYMNMANTFAETSRYEESAEMHLKSIAIKEQMNDSLGLSQSYGNLAIVFRQAKEYDRAIFFFGKSQRLAQATGNYKTLGLTASNVAVTYIEKGDFDSVGHFFDEAIANFSRIKDRRGLGLVYHNYGNFLFDTNELDSAEILMKKALELRKSAGSKTEISSTLANLGRLYLKAGNIHAAEQYLLDAKALLDTTQKTSGLHDVFSYLSALYARKADYKTAFAYQARVLDLEKSMLTQNEQVAILKAESKYELEKRDIQLAFEQEKQRERLLNTVLVATLLVLILMIIIGVFMFRRKQAKVHHRAELQQLAQQHRINTSRALRDAEEEERRKIASKLHDEVGAQLSIIRLNLSQLESDVFAVDSDANVKLQTAQKLLGELNETIRAISHSLMPVALEKYGLKSGILDLITSVNASGKIKVEEVIEGLDNTDDWSDEFCLGIYRIVQEVLSNIIKHAQATHVLVQIVELDRSITIYMEDNGKGLDSSKTTDGIGLKLLKSNIDYFNGAIEINGRESEGTFVLIELPIARGSVS